MTATMCSKEHTHHHTVLTDTLCCINRASN